MFHRILTGLSLLAILAAGPAVAGSQPATPSGNIPTAATGTAQMKPLGSLLREIALPSRIRFKIAPGLESDPVPARLTGTGWPEVVGHLLRGYNYVGIRDARGRLSEVNITGRNGDGVSPPIPAESVAGELLSYRQETGALPSRYRQLNPGSVYPIDIPVEQLRAMKKGTRVSVNLPDGRYSLIHDNVWPHGNGDLTWAGYVEGTEGRAYRAMLTLGASGVEGQIRTPGGYYQLESAGTAGWLVDMGASGLQPAPLQEDGRPAAGSRPENGIASTASTAAAKETPNATLDETGTPVIDVGILITNGLAGKRMRLRANHLVALANQAFADSRVNAVLRLAAVRLTGYPDGGSNDAALDNLTFSRGSFHNVPRLRSKTGADIMLLMRPFLLNSQGGNCGEAWVNGTGGDKLSPRLAFGVIGHGWSGGYFCPTYTLAHEVGHILGAAHDRAHANIPGAFPFSYGYGIPGLFGDIMSYIDPGIGLYANPDLRCVDHACGIPPGQPDSADVALTFNRTAETVSGFRKAVIP